jgi:hypothetical protein
MGLLWAETIALTVNSVLCNNTISNIYFRINGYKDLLVDYTTIQRIIFLFKYNLIYCVGSARGPLKPTVPDWVEMKNDPKLGYTVV